MKIHILTLTWNGVNKIERLSQNLSPALTAITHANGKLKDGFDISTWYIKDNGSKDNTVEMMRNYSDRIDKDQLKTEIFEIGHNLDNFAQGMNYLFKQANPKDEDIVLLLNNDVIIDDTSSFKYMFDLLNRTNAAIVGARLLYTHTNKLQHAGVIFGERYGKMPYHFRPGEVSDTNAEKDRTFQAVTAAVCLVQASSFKKIGGMHEQYAWAFEDIDMCLSIGQHEKIVYCGKTKIYHDESASLKKNPVNKLFLQQNVDCFKKRWWGKYKLDHELYLKNNDYNII